MGNAQAQPPQVRTTVPFANSIPKGPHHVEPPFVVCSSNPNSLFRKIT